MIDEEIWSNLLSVVFGNCSYSNKWFSIFKICKLAYTPVSEYRSNSGLGAGLLLIDAFVPFHQETTEPSEKTHSISALTRSIKLKFTS